MKTVATLFTLAAALPASAQLTESVPGMHPVGNWFWSGSTHTIVHDPAYSGQSVALQGRVYYPAETMDGMFVPAAMGAHRFVVFAHGCPTHQAAGIQMYDEYTYLGERLASWGYVTLALDLSSLNLASCSPGDPGAGIFARAETIIAAINDFFSTTSMAGWPPNLDVTEAVMGGAGHSRGGEAVLLAARESTVSGLFGFSHLSSGPIATIAPTDILRFTPTNYHLCIYGSADRDVWTGDPVRFYDRSNDAKILLFVYGANHLGFTDTFTSPCKPAGLSRALHHGVAATAITHHMQISPGSEFVDQPAILGPITPPILPSFQGFFLPVDTFETQPSLTVSSAGYPVSWDPGLTGLELPHATVNWKSFLIRSALYSHESTRFLYLRWDTPGAIRYDLVPPVSAFVHRYLSFRVAQPFDRFNTVGSSQSFTVQISDASGGTAFVSVSVPFPDMPVDPPGACAQGGLNPAASKRVYKSVMRTYRIELSPLGVDPMAISQVAFHFGSGTGALVFDDLGFSF
ncbi:MAG: hypothetical protein GY711_24285 [bacterium]|nr:hypothetical protein [bacterium]